MIIGHGAIAKVLKESNVDRSGLLFLAFGVPNSQETRLGAYEREKNCILREIGTHCDLRVVYFSSLCIFMRVGKYAEHKREMERLIKYHSAQWTIMRLGNILWAENPNQLVPWLKNWDRTTPLDNEWRHILTKEEFLYWVSLIPNFNCEMNITGTPMKPIELWEMIRESIGTEHSRDRSSSRPNDSLSLPEWP